METSDRIRGGLWGHLVGDALGVPHEFKAGSAIPAEVRMVMAGGYPKSFTRVPYGTWSDDGALTLALADSLATRGRVDPADLGGKMVAWMNRGAYTVDGRAYDMGNTTTEAVLRLMRGHQAEVAGPSGELDNGNGSLMRTLPLALWHKGTDEELFADAGRVSAVTHGHPVSRAACGAYSVAARHLLRGATPAAALVAGLKLGGQHLRLPLPVPGGSGFVLDTLSYAVRACRDPGSTYRSVVLGAIRLGADTDTTAAVAGGLVGVRDGMGAIPEEWLRDLRGRDMAGEVIEKFVAACF